MEVTILKTAIVLGGGGSRGAYEIGVWQALQEANIHYDIVTGTSIGALNGALMVQQDYQAACHLWDNLSLDKVMKDGLDLELSSIMDNKQKIKPFLRKYINEKGADITPLKDLIRQLVNEEKLRNSAIDYGLVTVRYPSLQAVEVSKQEIPSGQLFDYLLASASCFPAFPIHQFDQQQYIDGGYQDNLPIALALKMKAEKIIAVDLHYQDPIHPVLEQLPFVTTITPSQDLGSFLYFDHQTLDRNRKLGLLDGRKAMGFLVGKRYSFLPFPHPLADRFMMECTQFQILLDESNHPYIDTIWPQNSLLEKLLSSKEKVSAETSLVTMIEKVSTLMKLDTMEIYAFSTWKEMVLSFFHSENNEHDLSLFHNIMQLEKLQALPAFLKKLDRVTCCRIIKDKMKSEENQSILLTQLHWLMPLLADEILVAWFILFLESVHEN